MHSVTFARTPPSPPALESPGALLRRGLRRTPASAAQPKPHPGAMAGKVKDDTKRRSKPTAPTLVLSCFAVPCEAALRLRGRDRGLARHSSWKDPLEGPKGPYRCQPAPWRGAKAPYQCQPFESASSLMPLFRYPSEARALSACALYAPLLLSLPLPFPLVPTSPPLFAPLQSLQAMPL